MSVNQGNLCRDLIGANLQIKGKKVIDENKNANLRSVRAKEVETKGKIQAPELCVTGDATVNGNLIGNSCGTHFGPVVDKDGNQVVGFQQKAIGNSTPDLYGPPPYALMSLSNTANCIIQVLRNHGLIAPDVIF